MNVSLTHSDKLKILSILKCWDREQVTQDGFAKIQKETGIPARYCEITFWHYDILSILENEDWLIFKGGTCVQSYIPSNNQRASMDLDFNSTIGNPNSLKDKIFALNKVIDHVTVQGIDFGKIEYIRDDPFSGTLNFSRRMPSRFNDLEKINERRIQAKSIKIQINYKNAWLPAVSPIKKEPRFFILDYQTPKRTTAITHSSKEDLIADKILATCNVAGFGRERFKDVYDLGMLLIIEYDPDIVFHKLDLVAKKAKVDPATLLRGSVETISDFENRSIEAKGFASMVGKNGQEQIHDWEGFCFGISQELGQLLKK